MIIIKSSYKWYQLLKNCVLLIWLKILIEKSLKLKILTLIKQLHKKIRYIRFYKARYPRFINFNNK